MEEQQVNFIAYYRGFRQRALMEKLSFEARDLYLCLFEIANKRRWREGFYCDSYDAGYMPVSREEMMQGTGICRSVIYDKRAELVQKGFAKVINGSCGRGRGFAQIKICLFAWQRELDPDQDLYLSDDQNSPCDGLFTEGNAQTDGEIVRVTDYLEGEIVRETDYLSTEIVRDTDYLASETPVNTEVSESLKHIIKTIENNNAHSAERNARASFDDFYEIYPKKRDRKRAQSAWNRLKKSDQAAAMLDVQNRIGGEWKEIDPRFIPHPSSYLNGRRWEDQPDQARPDEAEKQKAQENRKKAEQDRQAKRLRDLEELERKARERNGKAQ